MAAWLLYILLVTSDGSITIIAERFDTPDECRTALAQLPGGVLASCERSKDA